MSYVYDNVSVMFCFDKLKVRLGNPLKDGEYKFIVYHFVPLMKKVFLQSIMCCTKMLMAFKLTILMPVL